MGQLLALQMQRRRLLTLMILEAEQAELRRRHYLQQRRRRRYYRRRVMVNQGPIKDYISELPTEILEKILIRLDGKQLANCRLICSRWCEVITQSDHLWQYVCKREMGIIALKAKECSGTNVLWYHIYRNLKLWPQITKYKPKFGLFFVMPSGNLSTGDLNQGILVINSDRYTKLMDVKRNSYKLIIINGTQVVEKVFSKNNVSVMQLKEDKFQKSCLYVQRTVQAENMAQEAIFEDIKAFTVLEDELYFCTSTNAVYAVDLLANEMTETECFISTYSIQDLFVLPTTNRVICVFTTCGYVVTYLNSLVIATQFLHSWSWGILQTKYSVLDEENFISYTNKMFRLNVPMTHCIHYGFPPVRVAILYNNLVVFATNDNKILMFDVSKTHMEINEASFTILGSIKKSEFIEKISVTETSVGPAIMVATKRRIYLCKMRFFPMVRFLLHFNLLAFLPELPVLFSEIHEEMYALW